MLRFLVLVSSVLVCQGQGFKKGEKQMLLDLHNYLRAKVATGKENGQPKAGNMMAVTWDDTLTEKAQSWADKCEFGHDNSGHRSVPNYQWVGQNFASGYTPKGAVKAWYDEVTVNKFVYNGHNCSGVCGNYTQVVWWNSWKIGCGQKTCDSKINIFCNYALGGNIVGTSIYLDSAPCSKCPHGFGFCMHNALCASKEQCSTSKSRCQCTIDECEQGELDSKNCECFCHGSCDGQMADVKVVMNSDLLKTSVLNLQNYLDCENKAGDSMCVKISCTKDVEWAKKNCNKFCKFCDPKYDSGFSSGYAFGDRSYPVQFYRTFLPSLFLLISSIFIF